MNPSEVCRKNVALAAQQTGWAGTRWTMDAIRHTEADISHMLHKLQKFTVTQSELNGSSKTPKRFVLGVLATAAAVGSVLGIGTSAVNAVNIATAGDK